ncbi:peptidase M16 inactive domain protein, partial [Vibrio parahaemolyticus AQ3810]
KSG